MGQGKVPVQRGQGVGRAGGLGPLLYHSSGVKVRKPDLSGSCSSGFASCPQTQPAGAVKDTRPPQPPYTPCLSQPQVKGEQEPASLSVVYLRRTEGNGAEGREGGEQL